MTLFGIALSPISYWCIYSNGYCYGTWIHHIHQSFTNPLYSFALYSLPLAVILVFISRQTFISWIKLAVWAIPLAVLFIASQPVVASFLSTDRDDASRLAAIIFTILSLILIVWKRFKSDKSSELQG